MILGSIQIVREGHAELCRSDNGQYSLVEDVHGVICFTIMVKTPLNLYPWSKCPPFRLTLNASDIKTEWSVNSSDTNIFGLSFTEYRPHIRFNCDPLL